ncbi:hypothetical protein AX16_009921 [Volvariella volvacea WC 439]|nr:hypothetical protein AX16_009921 [Volvariella volvacea WC 439]
MSAIQKIQAHPVYQQAQTRAVYHLTQLDKELSKYPVAVAIEKRTQLPKTYFAIGAVLLLSLLHLINAFAAPVSNLVGWAIPAYFSFKAIETQSTTDDVQWLTYWVIFGFFNFLESFAIRALLYYVPWYYVFKTIINLWLLLPAFRGAHVTYKNFVKPLLTNISTSQYDVATTATTTANAHQE